MASPALLTALTTVLDNPPAKTDFGVDDYAIKALKTPMAWGGSQFADERTFIVHLTPTEIAEVDAALTAFQETGLTPGHLSPETFKLPTLGPKLRRLSYRVHYEEGFFVLRGLEPWRYKRLENTIVFTGVASYIGNRRGVQCADGPVMTHIFDYSTEVEEKEKSNDGYLGHANRTSYLPFHTDDGHIISLYCLQAANIGGRTLLASSYAIYNHLLATRPEIIETLKEEWLWDSFLPSASSFTRPLLLECGDKFICNYRIRPFLGTPGYPRNAALGPLPRHQEEALAVVGELAHKMCLAFEFKTGDVQFLNNFSILHAREEFGRAQGEVKRRHLLRLVQMDEELGWDVPEAMRGVMGEMFEHGAEEEQFVWSPEPLPYVIGQ